ncbi:hypothetical protein [Chachezhania antarctica]|uniref:hypothetical protein n=1 Tax=Chachezhania antarctica TaxID=2340860 RepID=UPI0013CF34DF|nr:hypothetical protein [Chachezhania antarctica]|tara:strand:- start:1125 stop:1340 length:216 start_codon:yes stop_codon:yes gene_type:complete
MTETDLAHRARDLELRIASAGNSGRMSYQREFCSVLQKMRAAGMVVPSRLKTLEEALLNERCEADFDNLPV